MKWSKENMSKFLKIYEEYEVLWNAELSKYGDRNARDEFI